MHYLKSSQATAFTRAPVKLTRAQAWVGPGVDTPLPVDSSNGVISVQLLDQLLQSYMIKVMKVDLRNVLKVGVPCTSRSLQRRTGL